jgi:hypothetical protein
MFYEDQKMDNQDEKESIKNRAKEVAFTNFIIVLFLEGFGLLFLLGHSKYQTAVLPLIYATNDKRKVWVIAVLIMVISQIANLVVFYLKIKKSKKI